MHSNLRASFFGSRLTSAGGKIPVFHDPQYPVPVICACFPFAQLPLEPRLAGAPHMLEHMIFKHSDSDWLRLLRRRFRRYNAEFSATTNKEATIFTLQAPPEHAVALGRTMMRLLFKPNISEERIVAEKPVVEREFEVSRENLIDHLFDKFFAKMFPKSSPLHHPITGNPRAIRRLDEAAIKRVHEIAYTRSNLHFVGIGIPKRAVDEILSVLPRADGPLASTTKSFTQLLTRTFSLRRRRLPAKDATQRRPINIRKHKTTISRQVKARNDSTTC